MQVDFQQWVKLEECPEDRVLNTCIKWLLSELCCEAVDKLHVKMKNRDEWAQVSHASSYVCNSLPQLSEDTSL